MTDESTLIDDFNQKKDEVAAFQANPTPHLVITDPQACRATPQKVRDKLTELLGPCDVEFIPFANDPDQAWANVDGRDERKITRKTVDYYSDGYQPWIWGHVRSVFYPRKVVDGNQS